MKTNDMKNRDSYEIDTKDLKLLEIRCEQCKWYEMGDSVWGHCIGLPPTEPHVKMPWWERLAIFFHLYWIHSSYERPEYPFEGYRVVSWDSHACRLFEKRV